MAEFWQRCKLLRPHSHSSRPHLSSCSRLLASRLSSGQDHTAIPHIQSLIIRPHVTTKTLDSESSDSNPKAARSSLKARALRSSCLPLRSPALPKPPLRPPAHFCTFPCAPLPSLALPRDRAGRLVGLLGCRFGWSIRWVIGLLGGCALRALRRQLSPR